MQGQPDVFARGLDQTRRSHGVHFESMRVQEVSLGREISELDVGVLESRQRPFHGPDVIESESTPHAVALRMKRIAAVDRLLLSAEKVEKGTPHFTLRRSWGSDDKGEQRSDERPGKLIDPSGHLFPPHNSRRILRSV